MNNYILILLANDAQLKELHKTLFDENKILKASKKRMHDLTHITTMIMKNHRTLQHAMKGN